MMVEHEGAATEAVQPAGQTDPRRRALSYAAMAIVNHILESAAAPVEVRQRLNDDMDSFVIRVIEDVHAKLNDPNLV